MKNIRKDGPYSCFYLTATAIVSFTFIGLVDTIGVIVAVFIDHLNGSNAKGGWIGSIVYFLALSLSPLVVNIHARIGFRWCMFISSVLYCFALSVTPFITNMNIVFFTYSLPLGAATSIIGILTITTQQEYFSKYFGFAIGVRFGANSIGTVVISFILPIILDDLGYQMTFLSLLGLAPLLICYGFIGRHRSVQDTEKRNMKSLINLYKEFLQDKSFTICLIAVATYFLTCLIPLVFMVRYGVTLGYPLSKAKWLLVVRGLTTFITRLIVGRLGDIALRKSKVKMVLQVTFVLFGLLNLICSYLRTFPLLLVFLALIGVVDGVWWVTYSLLIMEITGGYYFNEAFSLVSLVVSFTVLVGSPAAGWIFDQTGDFRYVFYAVFVTSSLAAFLLTISSCVKVEKELSLVQKSMEKKEVETFKLAEDETRLYESGVDPANKMLYETTV